MVAVKLKCRKNKNHENSQFRMLIDTLQITTSYRVKKSSKLVQMGSNWFQIRSKWIKMGPNEFK